MAEDKMFELVGEVAQRLNERLIREERRRNALIAELADDDARMAVAVSNAVRSVAEGLTTARCTSKDA